MSNVHQYANLEVMLLHILNFILYFHCVVMRKVNVGDHHVNKHITQ